MKMTLHKKAAYLLNLSYNHSQENHKYCSKVLVSFYYILSAQEFEVPRFKHINLVLFIVYKTHIEKCCYRFHRKEKIKLLRKCTIMLNNS